MFRTHEKSSCHAHAVLQLKQIKAAPLDAQLSKQVSDDHSSGRTAFLAILGSIRYLARQGVAMRGHIEEQGNLMQLLTLRAQDISYCQHG